MNKKNEKGASPNITYDEPADMGELVLALAEVKEGIHTIKLKGNGAIPFNILCNPKGNLILFSR